MLTMIRPFIVAFLIGFFIGIERERSHPRGSKGMGVRTFVLFSLAGALAAQMNEVVLTAALGGFVFLAILLSYFRAGFNSKSQFIGITTEIAGAVVFCLGYVAFREPLLSSLLALAVLLILMGRERLHTFAREQIHPSEIQATVTILIISLAVISFLPNHTIDPWNIFNPQKFGILVMALSIIQFAGYVAIRVFGSRLGLMLLGFFGGLVSSTAVFLNLPRFAKEHPKKWRSVVVAGIFAQIAMLVEMIIVLSIASPHLMSYMMLPILAMIFAGGFVCFFISRNGKANGGIEFTVNPLDVTSLIKLALFIGGMLILIAIIRQSIGPEYIAFVTFLGGLLEVHSVSLATAVLFSQNKLLITQAGSYVGLAIVATYISKFGLLAFLARDRFALVTSLILFLMLCVGISVFMYLYPL